MARVTVEDSLKVIHENGGGIFHMILLAAGRAHQLQNGARPRVNPKDDRVTVVALREIAAGHIDFTDEIIPKKDIYGHTIKDTKNKKEDVSAGTEARKKHNSSVSS